MASRIVSADGPRIGWFKQPKIKSKRHLSFLAKLPCIACLCAGSVNERGIHAAHLRFSCAAIGKVNPGFGARSNDSHALPLCEHHHLYDQHKGNEREFWERLRVDPFPLCDLLWELSGNIEAARAQLLLRFRGG